MAHKLIQYSIAPLDNLNLNIDAAEIDNGLRIVTRSKLNTHVHDFTDFMDVTLYRLNDPDWSSSLESMTKVNGGAGLLNEHWTQSPRFTPPTHALEYYFEGDIQHFPTASELIASMETLFRDVITSLRLLKPSPVYISYIHQRPVTVITRNDPYDPDSDKLKTIHFDISTRFITPTHPLQSEQYQLLSTELPILRQIFKSVTDSSGPVRIALNSLYRQYVSTADEDRLLDIMIGLEALYGTRDPQLQYRLALRCSKHLGENELDYDTIYQRIYAAYSIRSGIVHGGVSSLTDKKSDRLRKALRKGKWLSEQNTLQDASQDMLQYTASLLRRGLRSFLLDTNRNHETFCQSLDDCIVTGKSFTPDPL